jgi:hypothetical protein
MRAPPGRLVIAVALVAALLLANDGRAQKKPKPDPAPPPAPTTVKKSKTYEFGGLDIDGKLKTPQLLYFLNRMKSEFDTTTPDRRSFIPELKRSTDEM